MNEPSAPPGQPSQGETAPGRRRGLLRLRFPFLCLLAFWLVSFALQALDKSYFVGFLYGLLSTTLITLLFLGWWAFNRGLRAWEKLLGFAFGYSPRNNERRKKRSCVTTRTPGASCGYMR